MASISRRTALKLGLAAGGVAFFPTAIQRVAMGSDQISEQIPARFLHPFRTPPLANPLKRVSGNLITPWVCTPFCSYLDRI